MAGLETNFRTFFLTVQQHVELFGESFHWNKVPDNPHYPCIRGFVVKDVPLKSQSRRNTRSGRALLQLDVFSLDSVQCSDSADLIRELHEYRGAIGEFSECLILVSNVSSLDETDTKSFRKIVELEIKYAE